MTPKIKKQKQISDVFFLNDIKFELFDAETNTISGQPVTVSQLAVLADCPYIIQAYGRRMFTDESVTSRLFKVLKLPERLIPTPENISTINAALAQSKGKKTFFLSLIDGVSSKKEPFTETLIMDIVDPRKINKETVKTVRSRRKDSSVDNIDVPQPDLELAEH